MSQNCSRCGTSNPAAACFCQGCGTPLTATQVQGRTVVLPTSRGAPFAIDTETIVERARQAFGKPGLGMCHRPMQSGPSDQREDLFIVNDISNSMGQEFDPGVTKLEAAIRSSVNLILNKAQIDANDEIGLIVFNERAKVLMGLHPIATHKPEMIRILQSLQPDDGTDINTGLMAARAQFNWQRQDVVRRIVVQTDGQGGEPLRTAEDLKKRGVIIDVVGVGSNPSGVKEALLRQMASVVDGQCRYRFIKDSRTLVAHYTQLAQKTCTHR